MVLAPSLDGMLALFAALRENIHVLAAKRFLDALMLQADKQPTALSTLPLTSLRERLMSFAPVATPRAAHGEMAFRELREHAVRKHVLQARRAMLSLIHARDFATEHNLDWRTYKAIRDTSLIRTGALGVRG